MKKLFVFIFSALLFLSSCFSSRMIVGRVRLDEFTILDYGNLQDVSFLSSTGDVNLLVVPIKFEDCSLTQNEIDNIVKDLEIAFFGTGNEMEFESVSSYYYKSSYGNLTINGEVTYPVDIDKTAKEIASITREENPYKGTNNGFYDKSYYPINYAMDELELGNDFSNYDLNKDKRYDAIYFIYLEDIYSLYCNKNNIEKDSELYNLISSLLWGFTYFYHDENDDLSINSYSFSSYRFMYTSSINLIDSHIYIHETGHLLGLSDYYNYDFGDKDENDVIDYSMPLGGLDMMDLNIGDHNPFSKMLMSWIKPTFIIDDHTYALKPFATTGDLILIPLNKLNNTPFSSYLLVEYYKPIGLNEFDSIYPYINQYPTMFKSSGIRIYRVNASLACADKELTVIEDFTKIDELTGYIDYLTSNTPSKSMLKSYYGKEVAYNDRLLTLITPNDNNYFQLEDNSYRFASEQDLFVSGSELTYNENNVNITLRFNINDDAAEVEVEVN